MTAAPAHADPPDPPPRPILAPLAPGQVVRIGPTAGTGTPTTDYGIGATDLCEFMEFPSDILQVCGDSFAGQGVGFGGWYAPIALRVETGSIDDPTGVRYYGVTGIDKPLLAEPTPPDSSQLPAGVVQINRENYMMVTTVRDRRRRQPRRPCARHHLGPYISTPSGSLHKGPASTFSAAVWALRGHGHARHDASINDCPARISSARVYPLMFGMLATKPGSASRSTRSRTLAAISSTLGAISIVEFGYRRADFAAR